MHTNSVNSLGRTCTHQKKKKKKEKKVHVITVSVISIQLVTSKHVNTVDRLQLRKSVYINTDVNKLTTPRNDSLGNFARGDKNLQQKP